MAQGTEQVVSVSGNRVGVCHVTQDSAGSVSWVVLESFIWLSGEGMWCVSVDVLKSLCG